MFGVFLQKIFYCLININPNNYLMKKFFIILAIAFIAINLNAQWFLGGDIDFNVRTSGAKKGKLMPDESLIGFNIAPKFGYYFNEKVAFGLGLSVGPYFIDGTETVTYYDYWGPSVLHRKYSAIAVQFGLAPFFRYSIFSYKKFSLMLEGKIGVSGLYLEKTYENSPRVDYKSFIIGVGVFNMTPVLGYKLTDHIQLEAGLNFFNIGYNIDFFLEGRENFESTYVKHDFNIGFNASSIFVVSQLNIGMIYKF
jgi:hypothetical protein